MPVCIKCGQSFRNLVKIEGVEHNLCNRKFCLECSPFGKHNNTSIFQYKCSECGETNPNNFYGDRKTECKNCFNIRTRQRQIQNRDYAISLLGGKCVACGYDKYPCSLQIHHTDPTKKDKNFGSMQGWSKHRIKRELEDCVLLCSNCHCACHAGYDINICPRSPMD